MKVLIYTDDHMLTLVRPPEDTAELFTPDYLEEEGVEIPDELALKAIEIGKQVTEVSRELQKYRK